jgi:hypothetical protein
MDDPFWKKAAALADNVVPFSRDDTDPPRSRYSQTSLDFGHTVGRGQPSQAEVDLARLLPARLRHRHQRARQLRQIHAHRRLGRRPCHGLRHRPLPHRRPKAASSSTTPRTTRRTTPPLLSHPRPHAPHAGRPRQQSRDARPEERRNPARAQPRRTVRPHRNLPAPHRLRQSLQARRARARSPRRAAQRRGERQHRAPSRARRTPLSRRPIRHGRARTAPQPQAAQHPNAWRSRHTPRRQRHRRCCPRRVHRQRHVRGRGEHLQHSPLRPARLLPCR